MDEFIDESSNENAITEATIDQLDALDLDTFHQTSETSKKSSSVMSFLTVQSKLASQKQNNHWKERAE